jgi:hypothetical protein
LAKKQTYLKIFTNEYLETPHQTRSSPKIIRFSDQQYRSSN